MKQRTKKDIINRLVDVPQKGKRPFWAREMSLLKRLLERWPDLDFWHKVTFGDKFPSLAYLLTDYGLKKVIRKYNEFTFEVPSSTTYNLGEKTGKDRTIPKKNQTLSSFLRNQ